MCFVLSFLVPQTATRINCDLNTQFDYFLLFPFFSLFIEMKWNSWVIKVWSLSWKHLSDVLCNTCSLQHVIDSLNVCTANNDTNATETSHRCWVPLKSCDCESMSLTVFKLVKPWMTAFIRIEIFHFRKKGWQLRTALYWFTVKLCLWGRTTPGSKPIFDLIQISQLNENLFPLLIFIYNQS